MFLRLVKEGATAARDAATSEAYPFAETPLVVAFAATDDLSSVRANTRLPLATLPEMSTDDAYLVLPLRARDALLSAFARGRGAAIAAWFNEAVVVRAEVTDGRSPKLWVGAVWRAVSVLDAHEGHVVSAGKVGEAVRFVNELPHVEGLAPGGLLDRKGVAAMVTQEAYVGISRRGVRELGLGADAVEPTFVWAERTEAGVRVRVALAASEEDSMLALLAPITLVA